MVDEGYRYSMKLGHVIGCLLLAMIAGCFFGAAIYAWIDENGLPRFITNCPGSGVEGITNCLRAEMRPYYYFNISNLDRNLSEEDLKREGGVCWHYAKWYAERGNEMGLNTTTTNFTIGDKLHRIAILSGEHKYCIADQMDIHCWGVK